MNPGITLAVSHSDLGQFFVNLVDIFAAKQGGLPLCDLRPIITGWQVPFADDTTIDSINAWGGRLQSHSFSAVSVKPAENGGPETFAVGFNLAGHAVYDNWQEEVTTWNAVTGGSHGGTGDNTTWDRGAWSFDLSVAITAKVTITIGPDSGAHGQVLQVAVAEWGCPQGITITNLKLPDQTLLTTNGWWNDGSGESTLRDHLGNIDFALAFIDAANTTFASWGDSGVLVPGTDPENPELVVLFAPQQLVYPPSGGLQMSMNGTLLYNGEKYAATTPGALDLPGVPTSGRVFAFNEYLLDEVAWVASQRGDLNYMLPPAGASPSEWTTDRFNPDFPSLYNAAPSAPFTITITNPADQGPRFAFAGAWHMSAALFKTLAVPDSVSTALASYLIHVYPSASDPDHVLNAVLSEADYNAWGQKIVSASASHGLTATTPFEVDLEAPIHGAKTSLLKYTIDVTHWVGAIAIRADKATATQALTYAVDYQEGTVRDVIVNPNVQFDPKTAQAFNDAWVEKHFDAVTAALQKYGDQGVPIPATVGFILADPVITVTESSLLVEGDTDSVSSPKPATNYARPIPQARS